MWNCPIVPDAALTANYTNFTSAPSEEFKPGPSKAKKPRRRARDGETQRIQRATANERERRRMYCINRGFDILRERLPVGTSKISKVDTLKHAIQYISELQSVLQNTSARSGCECLVNQFKKEAEDTSYVQPGAQSIRITDAERQLVMTLQWNNVNNFSTGGEQKRIKVWKPEPIDPNVLPWL
ncbi:transcription factor Ash2 [Aphelenchoides avenae]|nr:transcription factor Ash2 [Aphelenchus avenae]